MQDMYSDLKEPGVPLQLQTTAELLKLLKSEIEEYTNGVKEKFTLVPSEYDEMTSLTSTPRDEIHSIISILKKREEVVGIGRIQELDKEWQDWCLERIKIDFASRDRYPNTSRAPRAEWWWHVSYLDELSEEERSTI